MDQQSLSHFPAQASRLIAELNPIQSLAACQDLVALYDLSKQTHAEVLFLSLLSDLTVAEPYRLPLWQAGMDAFIPSSAVLVELVLGNILPAGRNGSVVPHLLARCEQHQRAADIAAQILARTADEDLSNVVRQLQLPQKSTKYVEQLTQALSARGTDQQLVRWWMNGFLSDIPGPVAARGLLDLEGEEHVLACRKVRKKPGSALAMEEELRLQLRRGHLTHSAGVLLGELAETVRAQGRSRWQVDRWAESIVNNLSQDIYHLPALEQVEWWLRGLGGEPATPLLLKAAPLLSDNFVSRLWKIISTPGAKALVPALLPWMEREAPPQWVLLTLEKLHERRGAFYDETCRSIEERVVPNLHENGRVQLWLEGVSAQPKDELLAPVLAEVKEEACRIVPKLSAESLVRLLPGFLDKLTVDLPLTGIVLRQLTKYIGTTFSPQHSELKQQLIEQLLPAIDDYLYLRWWQVGLLPPPEGALLVRALPALQSEERKKILGCCSNVLLTDYGRWILNQPVPFVGLALEAAVQLFRTASDPTSEQVLADILCYLPPALHVREWLAGKLPAPSAPLLEQALPGMEESINQQALGKYPVPLLIEYSRLLLSRSLFPEDSARAIVLRLGIPGNTPDAQKVAMDVMGRFEPEVQLRWWLQDKNLRVAWKAFRLVLEGGEELLKHQIAHELAATRMSALMDYLPEAPPKVLVAMVDVFTHPDSWQWARDPAGRASNLTKFTEQLCRRLLDLPLELQGLLCRLKNHCLSTKANSNRYLPPQMFADVSAVTGPIARLLVSVLSAENLLSYWKVELLNSFPSVTLEELARFVASQHEVDWFSSLGRNPRVPMEVLLAWQALGTLPDATIEELDLLAEKHTSALAHTETLAEVRPWLVENLSTEQLRRLWAWGYPFPLYGGWTTLPLLERIFTAIRLASLQRLQELPDGFLPNAEEIGEWLAEQYWEAGDQADASRSFTLLLQYLELALVELPTWNELEDEVLLRCEGVVKVRLWLYQQGLNRERTFNYYGFRRGYSRLRPAEQRNFLAAARQYVDAAFTQSLHQRRRRLIRQENGVSVYRVSLAHCCCIQAGYLEIDLPEKMHTQPVAYVDAHPDWNKRFIKAPWAGCPVLVEVDDQSRSIIKIKGVGPALVRYPLTSAPAEETFDPGREAKGTRNKPRAYQQDDLLQDELTEYLSELTDDACNRAMVIEEPVVIRERREPSPRTVDPIEDDFPADDSNDLDDLGGEMIQPRQTVLYPVTLQDEVVFVWTSVFANANRATYLFRAPVREQAVALERLTRVLKQAGNIRSALLTPGQRSHRLRCHLGYVRTLRGRRGHAQAFERWQTRFEEALLAGRSVQHPYDPDSDWQLSELREPLADLVSKDDTPQPENGAENTGSSCPDDTAPAPVPRVTDKARKLLQQLLLMNQSFLANYPA